MKCEERIGEYCRQAVTYKKYAEIRRCNKCCIGCMELCGNVCDKALEVMKGEVIIQGNSQKNIMKIR